MRRFHYAVLFPLYLLENCCRRLSSLSRSKMSALSEKHVFEDTFSLRRKKTQAKIKAKTMINWQASTLISIIAFPFLLLVCGLS